MSGYLLDTCVIAEFKKRAPDVGLCAWLARVNVEDVYLSAVTVGELRYSIAELRDKTKRAKLEHWLSTELLVEFPDRVLPFDFNVADLWRHMRAQGMIAGRTIPPIDAMIAATALHHDLTVITRNETDFVGTGAHIVNPWSG